MIYFLTLLEIKSLEVTHESTTREPFIRSSIARAANNDECEYSFVVNRVPSESTNQELTLCHTRKRWRKYERKEKSR